MAKRKHASQRSKREYRRSGETPGVIQHNQTGHVPKGTPLSEVSRVLKSGTLSWMAGEIPSVTGGKSPAMDFANALTGGHPLAERLARQAMKEPKEEASLADLFLAETYSIAKRLGLTKHQAKAIEPVLQSYRHDMRRAHRFVLDNDFVRYATEISSTCKPEKLLTRLQYATLPYDITWIEFDLKTKVRVMRDLHGMDNSKFNWDEVAERLGLIIRRLSDTEAVVEMVCETFGDNGLIGTTICYFFSVREYEFTGQDGRGTGCRPFLPPTQDHAEEIYQNKTPEEIVLLRALGPASLWGYAAEGKSTVIEKMAQMKDLRLPHFLLRHGTLGTGRMRAIIEQLIPQAGLEATSATIAKLLVQETTEFTGMMRWIVIILACLNEVPIDAHRVEPTGTIRTGLTGRRPMMDYHRIVLRVPKEKPVQYIERLLRTSSRRRAHEVRSHWRTYLHAERCPRDEHQWEYDYSEGYRLCGICMAFGRLIHEHVRGDPSLGWVRKEYVVKPTKQE
jgi:hypothetical protein